MLLEVKNVTSGYEKSIIVNDVSIYVDKEEFVTIIGPNGSGKSTLMKTIVGFINPFSGDIRFNGRSIIGLRPDTISNEGIAWVPQLDNVFRNLTIRENLLIGKYKGKKDCYSINEILELFPMLKGRENIKAQTLSGGERQMLALARALINKPALLCLDEPTAALAPNLVKIVLDKLAEIKKNGTPILLIEQNARQSLKISDRGYVLATGTKVYEGNAKELLDSPEIQKHYLGVRTDI